MDVGGTLVNCEISGFSLNREFESGRKLSAKQTVNGVKRLAADWDYDVGSIGYLGW